MRRIPLLSFLLLVVLLTGCATTVRYSSYTSQRFSPKPADYSVSVYSELQKPPMSQPYVVIGQVNVSGHLSDGVNPDGLVDQAKAIARKKGADAIINLKTRNFNYTGVYSTPGGVSYQPVVFEGRHRDHVVYVEHYHRPRYIPYEDTLFTVDGELIVFRQGSY